MSTKNTRIGVIMESKGGKKVAADLDRVGKSTETVGRQQTRLGQASASAGRQFSAQASGLGGLVAAYAGAAATVFALQAAFDALGKAARAEEIVRGTRALALEVGLNGQRILDNVQKITQGQLSLVEAAEQVNIAFAAGFDQKQIEGLTEVSLKASRALGRNLADAFTRITRGAAKLEPELLDELGIFVRIDPAVERYANKLNIAASQLTNFERRQAFVNAIIDEGNEKFEAIGTSAPTTQKSLEKLQATIQNLTASFGQFIANTLQPIVDYFNNNFNNAILLFVGILTLVFGKATQIVSSFVASSLNSLGGFADRLQDKAIIPLQKIQQTQASLLKDLGEGGLKGIRTKTQIGQDPAQAQRFAQALALQRTEQELSASQIQKINRAYKEQIKFLEATGKTGSATYNNLNSAVEKNNKLVAEGGKRVKVFGSISNFASKAVTGLSVAIGKLGAVLNGLFVFGAVFQLLGVDIIGLIQKFFASAEASENFKLGLLGVVQASSLGTQSLADYAKGLGITKDEVEKLDEKIISVNKTLTTIGRETIRSEELRLSSKLALTEAETNRVLEIRRQLKSGNLSTDTRLNALGQEKINVQRRLNKAIEDGNSDLITQLRLEQEIIRRIEESINRFGQDLNQLVGSISSATGIASNLVADLFAGGFIANIDKVTGAVTVLGERLVDTNRDGVITFEEQTESVQKFTSAAFIAGATVEKAEDAFERGATTSDKLSAQIGGIASQLTEIQKSGLGSAEEIKKLTDRLNELTKLRDRLRTVELIGKGISKAFGGEIGAIDTAIFKGLVNVTGDLAKNSNEIAKNQTRFLLETLRTTAAAAQNVRIYEKINETIAETGQFIAEDGTVLTQQIKINAVLQEQAANNAKAAKALAGSIFEIFQTSQKLIKTEEIRALQLKNQTESLREQLAVLLEQNLLAQKQATQKAQVANSERELTIAQKRFDLSKELAKARDEEFKASQKLLDLKVQELTTQQNIANIQRDADIARARAGRQTQIAGVGATLDDAQDDPRSTQAEIFALRRKLIELEKNNATKIAEEDSKVANDNYINELAIISARKTILGNELDNLETRTLQQLSADRTEKDLLTQRQAIETQKIQNEKENLLARFNIDNQIAQNTLNDIDRREALFKVQNKSNMAQVENNKVFLKAVQALNEGEFTRALQAYLKEVEGITIETDDFAKDLIADAESSLNKASSLLTSNADAQGEIFNLEREIAGAKKEQLLELFNIENGALAQKLEDTAVIQQIEQDALAQKQAANLAALAQEEKVIQQQLQNIQTEGDASFAALQQKLSGIEIEKQKTMQALNTRLDVLNKEANVAEQLKMQTAAIAKSNLTGFFMEMNEAFINGSATFSSISNSFKDMVGNMLREIQAAVFRKTIVNPLVEGLVGGIPFLSAAGGGVQHKASGGLLRDRVPALLEPGEFVISRRGAKAIGIDNLQALNSGVEKDAESKLLASLFGRKVKKMVAGGRSGPGDMGAQNDGGMGFGHHDMSSSDPGGVGGAFGGGGGSDMFGGGGGGGDSTMQQAAALLGVSQGQALKNIKENREKFRKDFQDSDDKLGIDTFGTKGKKGKEQGLLSKAIISGIASLAAGALTGGGSFVAQLVAGEMIKGGIKETTGLEGLDVIGGLTGKGMAAGGQVRDRVPAMLEPGEFVIRKPMAKAIGGAVLNQMNSTGKPPAVNVNMTNQGSPKDVQVAPPKMNGDKMIVDIITRDMRNNGAIRKSIRKGR